MDLLNILNECANYSQVDLKFCLICKLRAFERILKGFLTFKLIHKWIWLLDLDLQDWLKVLLFHTCQVHESIWTTVPNVIQIKTFLIYLCMYYYACKAIYRVSLMKMKKRKMTLVTLTVFECHQSLDTFSNWLSATVLLTFSDLI